LGIIGKNNKKDVVAKANMSDKRLSTLERSNIEFFLEIGSFYNSPRVKQLSFTVFESIQLIF